MKRYNSVYDGVYTKPNEMVEEANGEWVRWEDVQIGPPTLTKLEYFALIIGAHQDGTYRDLWADNAIERAKLLIAELDKVQAQEAKP